MRVPAPVVLLLSVYFTAACSERYGEDVCVVTGRDFIYEIPRRYDRLPKSFLYPGGISGDDGEVISLLLTHNDVEDSDLGDSWELSMLLFWDRDYGQGEELAKSARGLLDDAAFQGASNGFYQYRSSLGEYQRDYYLNFDPFGGDLPSSDGNYIVRTKSSPAFEIGGIKTVPKETCALHARTDGILVQLGAIGHLCSVDKFDSLYAFMEGSMRKWARPKQDQWK